MNSFPHQVWSTLVRLAAGLRDAIAWGAPTSTRPFTAGFDRAEQFPPVERELESVFHPGLLENMHQMSLNSSRSDQQRLRDFLILQSTAEMFDDVPLSPRKSR